MKNIGLTQGKITVPESTIEEFLKLPYIEESPAWEYQDLRNWHSAIAIL
ncbi:hypothetical protein [Nostoc sp.]